MTQRGMYMRMIADMVMVGSDREERYRRYRRYQHAVVSSFQANGNVTQYLAYLGDEATQRVRAKIVSPCSYCSNQSECAAFYS